MLCSLLLHKRLNERVMVMTDLCTEEHIHLLDTSNHFGKDLYY